MLAYPLLKLRSWSFSEVQACGWAITPKWAESKREYGRLENPKGQQSAQNGVELKVEQRELSRRDGQCYP
jgi:hypothetical protein